MNTKLNKIISPLLVITSFFIIILFTKDAIFELQANFDEKNNKIKISKEKEDEYNKLIKIKKELKTKKNKDVEKYLVDLNEDEILNYLYSMVEKGNSDNKVAKIKSLSLSKGKKNELGFKESDISLVINFNSERRMREILDSLIGKDSKYKFFINSFSYANFSTKPNYSSDNDNSFQVTIPLKIFYK